ncbi:MAG: D-alanyl-D-alanine carboxypeptidase, partial [Leptolyngbyaceae cyanobacterium SM1_3_5]|nr:D-alanyl-D-alanine carboxypeptidase [Leptolyngbyaceae cyanobacterium SM1_3_5]
MQLSTLSNPSAIDRPASPAVAGLDSSADRLAVSPVPSPTPAPSLLGHFPYAQAPASSLAAIVSDGSIKLRQPAATRFVEMVKAANAQGVALRPISGFRSTAEQEHIFFEVKAERGQQVQQRAVVSAPPGYSEHHTGYAIDIGDGANPATDLQQSFQTQR